MGFNGTIDINALLVILGLSLGMYRWVRQRKIDQQQFIEQLSASHALPLHQSAGGIAVVFSSEIEEHLMFYQGQIDSISAAISSQAGNISARNLMPPSKTMVFENYSQKIDAMGFDVISHLVHYYSNLDELTSTLEGMREAIKKSGSVKALEDARKIFITFQKTALRTYVELLFEAFGREKSVLLMTAYFDKIERLESADKKFREALALIKLRYTHIPSADIIEQALGPEVRAMFDKLDVVRVNSYS